MSEPLIVNPNEPRPIAYRVRDLPKVAGGGSRSKYYEAIAAGRLPARKVLGVTVVTDEDLRRFILESPMVA